MPDKSQTQTPASEDAMKDYLAQFQKSGLGNMVGMNAAWMETLSDMSAEMAGFVADRIKADVATQHEILHCKDLSKLQHIQAKFVQKAIDQYRDETGKLVEIGTKAFYAAKD